MPAPKELETDPSWVSLRTAARILGRSTIAVMRLVIVEEVAVKLDPGKTPKYCRADLERIARQSHQLVGA